MVRQVEFRFFSEDDEARCFLKVILGTGVTRQLHIHDVNVGCGNLINLAKIKIPQFTRGHCIVVLDGDDTTTKLPKHFVVLPGGGSPEQLLSDFLSGLSDTNSLWSEIGGGYTKQVCFRDVSAHEISGCRVKAKKWFKAQKPFWGRNGYKVIKPWIQTHSDEVEKFRDDFITIFNFAAEKNGLTKIEK